MAPPPATLVESSFTDLPRRRRRTANFLASAQSTDSPEPSAGRALSGSPNQYIVNCKMCDVDVAGLVGWLNAWKQG